MDASTAEQIIGSVVDSIGDIMVATIPITFGLFATLIGLWFVYEVIQSKLGGPKR